MTNVKSLPGVMAIALILPLILVSCDGFTQPTGLSGTLDVADFSVAKDQTQQVSGDLMIIASGTVNISGALTANGDTSQSITITAEGDVNVSGTVIAGNGSSGSGGGNLTIVSNNGNIVLAEGSSTAAGDGGSGQTTSAARVITLTDQGTVVLKTISGGAGGGGGSVTLRALNGDITIADTAGTIRIGSGGNGATITVSGEDLLTTDSQETFENGGGDSGDLTIEADTFNGQAVGAAGEVDLTGTNFLIGGRGGDAGDVFWGMDVDGNSTWPDATAKIIARAKQTGVNLQQIPSEFKIGAGGGSAYFETPGNGASVSVRGRTATEPGVDGQNAGAYAGRGGKCKSPFCTIGGRGGNATARGGDGARGEKPDGRGGWGGDANALGGRGGFGFITDGPDGSASAIGGSGEKGGGQCPDDVVLKGGRGGHGGKAIVDVDDAPGTALAGDGGDGGDGQVASGDVGFGGGAFALGGGTLQKVDGDDGLPGATCPSALMVRALLIESTPLGTLGIGQTVDLSCVENGNVSTDPNCECEHVHGSIIITGLAGGPFDDPDFDGCGHGCIIMVPEDELNHTCN